jgi:pyruvate dehydrogenase E1 component beta subunit
MTTATTTQPEAAPGRTLTYVAAIVEAQAQLLRDDPTVFLAGEDVALYGGARDVAWCSAS